MTSIGIGAFFGTAWLEEKRKENPLVIINGILIDGRKCSGDVIIPDSVKSIGYEAFLGCSSITNITIPDSVTSICSSAFYGCSSLEKIVIENPECEIYDSAYTISNGYDDHYKPYFNGTIYGYENSTAQKYAEKYGRKFEIISKSPETAGGDALTGDANCDGVVDLADATAIIQHIGNEAKYALSKQGLANADCNSDGKVTGADALAVQKLEAKLISSLPNAN